jgi:enediyne polyketide synthase
VTELYGGVLFQGKRFQRLTAYRQASARRAIAEISTGAEVNWFAPFLPQEQILADPGTRDAMMHAIQCCVPDATLLPQGIEKLYLTNAAELDAEYVVLDARERFQDGDSYTYDIDVLSPEGVLVERWEGLTLRAVRKRDGAGPWVPSMLSSYLERSLERVLGGSRTVVVEPDPYDGAATIAERRAQTELAASRAIGGPAGVHYRPDGKPELAGVSDGLQVSASHKADLTLAVVGSGSLTCDVETAVEREAQDWSGLLGPDLLALSELLAAETGESPTVSSTRVWCALECVRKTGAMTQALAVHRVHADGWAVLSSGEARIATWATTVNGQPQPVVFAVLAGEEN